MNASELLSITLPSLRPSVTSVWHGHLSFAHWLVQAVNPNIIVELGTHNGLSYSAFCNAIVASNIDAKCYAIDTWEGDIHAGSYSSDVYDDLLKFNSDKFDSVGVLVRSYFDEALSRFDQKSVDILHIDGLHTYEAVRHDFETWKSKLSDRAVVLFHDTEVRGGDFGVWKFWEELASDYPSFKFLHSAGLGVLAVGKNQPKALLDLCSTTRSEAEKIRDLFERASHISRVYGQHLLMEASDSIIMPGSVNLARNKPVTQSSNLDGESIRESPTDGIRDGKFGFHTLQELNPWIMIDLEQAQNLSKIILFNRLDDGCIERARNLSVAVSCNGMTWTTIYTHDGSIFGGIDGRPLLVSTDVVARFVRVWLDDINFFHLDQIEIY